MCFAKLDLLMSLLLKYYYDILAETCHFLTGLDFTAAWLFSFIPANLENVLSAHWTNGNFVTTPNSWVTPQSNTFPSIPGSFAVVTMVQWDMACV